MSTTVVLVMGCAAMAMGISWIVLFPVRHFARQLGLLDRPGGHSSHAQPTPMGGGIGVYLGMIGTLAIATWAAYSMRDAASADALAQSWQSIIASIPCADSIWDSAARTAPGVWTRISQVWWLMAGASVLMALGLLDDRYGLPITLRLGTQFIVAAAIVLGMGIELSAYLAVGWLTKILSILWIVALINSFNMLDNMDMLSGGVAAIIAASMAMVMLTTPDPGTGQPQVLVAALLMLVSGALMGFLIHNRPPARIFLGDGGSYLVGYFIAVATLMATFVGGEYADGSVRPHAILAPLCAMAVPLYDTITVLWIRVWEGRNPFLGDNSHLSHRLVDLGLSRSGAVSTIHLVTATCGLSALLLTHVTSLQAIAVLGIVGCMMTLLVILESTQWRRPKS